MSTKFFTNENGNSLFKKFTGAFEHIANMHAFHAVAGYFRASGYFPIRDHLLKVPEVKILVGIDVDKISAEAKKRGLLFFCDPERTRELRKIYSQIREKILTPITVRRTRKDVDSYKDYRKDLVEQGISFPEIAPPRSIEYKMDKKLERLFYDTVGILVNNIGYYRYRAIEFLDKEIQDLYYMRAQRASRTLAYIMMTQMVKRLESSFHAFKITLNRFRVSTERMIEMFDKGKVYVAPDANINDMIDKEWLEEDIDAYIMELSLFLPR